ncbi:Gas vesicle synthesis protein GvpL/GvpF [Halopelagius inordinatus]|uniref:Gas vesicle synthesis protein GvpL/GvpF n=1 Tax=Halopelagius inordinatus TaxID=553467 RepID=A0A1I2TBM2_9EURY|nr:GvpL/GvpF family gas vesicle protein [Halopelagius inordinatus]SFG61509.1 Gas vesicle synthesis protein GvpL/GvpF [Halopelagius inordinatus]
MSEENLYVYGATDAEDLDLELSGVGGADRVYTITHKSISAIVSDIDTTDPERTDENVQTHDEVLREVMEHGDGRTVVPMQFGMAFKDARALKNVLRGTRPAFTRALNDVEGTVELGVKVVSQEGTDLSQDAVEAAAERLTDASINEVENGQFSDRLLLNRSYLVERENQDEFGEAVDELEAELGDVLVQYTGPWAPYNFVDIHVGVDR